MERCRSITAKSGFSEWRNQRGWKFEGSYSFLAKGKPVVGVQYRKVRFKHLGGDMSLGGNEWVMFTGDGRRTTDRMGKYPIAVDLRDMMAIENSELGSGLNVLVEREEFVFFDI